MTNQIAPSTNAPCPHYGQCGGCSLQHLDSTDYQAFKHHIIDRIVSRLGLTPSIIAPLITIGQGTRRRAELKVSVNKAVVNLGFYAPQSHDVVHISQCLICNTAIMDMLPAFHDCLNAFKKPSVIKSIQVTSLEHGIDMVIATQKPLKAHEKTLLATFGETHHCVRISQQHDALNYPDTFFDRNNATITIAGVTIDLPAGAFLQATATGQDAIISCVLNYLKDCRHIADLFSGCGTYSFALASQAISIEAFEVNEAMSLAAHNAATKHDLNHKIRTSTRDLFARPLKEHELNRFDAVVINPPRTGAQAQIKQLSSHQKIHAICMVSCNPSTFERDAKQLLSAGYKLTSVTPIDQFYWSNHLELVGLFIR